MTSAAAPRITELRPPPPPEPYEPALRLPCPPPPKPPTPATLLLPPVPPPPTTRSSVSFGTTAKAASAKPPPPPTALELVPPPPPAPQAFTVRLVQPPTFSDTAAPVYWNTRFVVSHQWPIDGVEAARTCHSALAAEHRNS